jgi:uncharacterized protein YciI
MEFAYVIRPSRTSFPADATDAERDLIGEHFEHLKELHQRGVVALAGRCADATFGIVIFRAQNETSARQLMQADPAVRDGLFIAQLHPFRIALGG